MRITGNRWDAEDLSQDAMIKLIEAVQRNPERPITKAFLYRIAKNAWIDCKRTQKIRTVPLDLSYEKAELDPLLSSRELLEQVGERLSPKMAVIILLMDVFDFTARETAEYVGMREASVQVTLGRARLKLKQMAQESFEGNARKSPKARKETIVDMDALVDAFHRCDPKAIYRAYLGLTEESIYLTEIKTLNARLHFTFKDPDGNYFSVVSNK
ncbi:RNA polymerase subunit sigma-24 [Paenibacillus selenitireducens]|uniref:RNA polymerase subunit sigma-24 n=2 Tax=Paenibacillus selenitireducens TaxID=1324314 RepID=A0A1T2X143_9BACL|nr:RNA polymerase subunit sigma-24 [Paenibacillus selenitireducens]